MSQSKSVYQASIGLLVVLVALSGYGSSRVYTLLSEKKNESDSLAKKASFTTSSYRLATPPSRVADRSEYPQYRRSLLGHYQIVDLSDSRHVIVSEPIGNKQKLKFYHGHIDSDSKLEHLEPLPDPEPGYFYVLTSEGKPSSKRLPMMGIRRRLSSAIPFVNPHSFGGQVGGFRQIHTVLNDGTTIRLGYSSQPEAGSRFKIDRYRDDEKVETLYSTEKDLTLLHVESGGAVWFQEGVANTKGPRVRLGRVFQGKVQTFDLPKQVQFAMNIAVSENIVAVSGATTQKAEPNRAYALNFVKDSEWTELPLDSTYNFSVARAVSSDGWIFGSQEKIREGSVRPVAWKDGAIIHLNEIEAWPKTGTSTYIVGSNKHGDLYLRCILDSSTGMSEYYLLVRSDQK